MMLSENLIFNSEKYCFWYLESIILKQSRTNQKNLQVLQNMCNLTKFKIGDNSYDVETQFRCIKIQVYGDFFLSNNSDTTMLKYQNIVEQLFGPSSPELAHFFYLISWNLYFRTVGANYQECIRLCQLSNDILYQLEQIYEIRRQIAENHKYIAQSYFMLNQFRQAIEGKV